MTVFIWVCPVPCPFISPNTATPTLRENYLCAFLVYPIQSCIPNSKSLAQVPAVFEILRFKRIGVTSLTFQGHVTSSVTWPFDSPYAISYWCSIVTKPLSLMVSEIFNVKCNAMVDVTLIRRSRTHHLATIHNVTDDRRRRRRRQTQQCCISATVSTVG